MTLGNIFWILLIVAAVLNGVRLYRDRSAAPSTLLFFVLIVILGWAQFGNPIK